MDSPHDNRFDEAALRAHDDTALEGVRFELARDGDHRLRQVVHVLAIRATSTIVLTCRELGARRGIGAGGVARAVADAQARVQIRLRRPEHLPAIDRLASGIARACVEAQPAAATVPPKLAPRVPELRVIKGLHDGTVRPNNPEMS
jgi:hypothetical protein